MTIDDSTKAYVLRLLKRGLVTQSEAARMAGIDRQLMAHWARDIDTKGARKAVIDKLWAKRPR